MKNPGIKVGDKFLFSHDNGEKDRLVVVTKLGHDTAGPREDSFQIRAVDGRGLIGFHFDNLYPTAGIHYMSIDSFLKPYKETKQMLQTIQTSAVKLRDCVRPYEKYILMAAIIYVVDYFLFDGRYTERLRAVAKKSLDKLTATLDAGIDKLLGDSGND